MLIGAHLSINGGIEGIIEQIKYLDINTFQFFLSAPQNWKTSKFRNADIEEFHKLRKYVEIIAVHSPYIVNLASLNPKLRNISVHKVYEEMKLANALEIDYYIIHPGSPKSNDVNKGIEYLADSLNKIISRLNKSNIKILIEWSAGEGFEIGKNIDEIKSIIDLVTDKDTIGICLDTCHLFTSGVDISNKQSFDEFKFALKKHDLLRFIKIFHMNDSKCRLASKKDRHEHIGKGYIGLEGFKNITGDPDFSKMPFIIETPKENDMDKNNINILKGIFLS